MELSYVGPIISGIAGGLIFCMGCYIMRIIVEDIPFRSRSNAIEFWTIVLLFSTITGGATYLASSFMFFNKEYYATERNEAMERKKVIEDDGYEYWSFIESRPIQKSKIHSCHGTSLVTDRAYKEVDVDSNEVKDSRARLHVFCKLDKEEGL